VLTLNAHEHLRLNSPVGDWDDAVDVFGVVAAFRADITDPPNPTTKSCRRAPLAPRAGISSWAPGDVVAL
jgi:hypothetical protein